MLWGCRGRTNDDNGNRNASLLVAYHVWWAEEWAPKIPVCQSPDPVSVSCLLWQTGLCRWNQVEAFDMRRVF